MLVLKYAYPFEVFCIKGGWVPAGTFIATLDAFGLEIPAFFIYFVSTSLDRCTWLLWF